MYKLSLKYNSVSHTGQLALWGVR